jgi:hypothetical protein
MTQKARFIETNSALTQKEKERALIFFTRHPNYENRIDWNKKIIPFDEFERVFTLAENSARNRKKKTREDPKTMLAAHNCPVIGEAENFLIAVPLDWQAAVFCNSFQCGGEGAKWCVGNSKSPEQWETFARRGQSFYFIYFKKEDPAFGKKIMLLVTEYDDWRIYFQNNYSTNSELLKYYLNTNTISPVEPEGRFDFNPAACLAKLLGRPVLNIEALKQKVRGDRSRGSPAEAIAAYTQALELGCHKAGTDRAWEYARIGQKKKALADLLAILHPDLNEKPAIKHYMEVIKKWNWAFTCLPKKYKTGEFYFAAVEKLDCYTFFDLPKKYRTEELCFEAVRQDVYNLRYVPKKYRTTDLYLTAARQGGTAIKYVPKKHITAELCLAAVRRNGMAIKYVPKKYITAELCLTAVQRKSGAIKYVPQKYITVEFCLAALKDYKTIFHCVQKKARPEIALALVRKNGLFLDYLPKKHITAELCIEAVRKTGMALELVPKKYKTQAFYFEAVKANSTAFEHIPETHKTTELYIEAVRKNCPGQLFFEY